MKRSIFGGMILLLLIVVAGCAKDGSTTPSLTVSLSASPNSGKPPLAVAFTASASITVVSYEWDFNGDSIYEGNTSANTTTFIYNFNAVYTAKVRVTDERGNKATATAAVNVSSN